MSTVQALASKVVWLRHWLYRDNNHYQYCIRNTEIHAQARLWSSCGEILFKIARISQE